MTNWCELVLFKSNGIELNINYYYSVYISSHYGT